MSHKTTVNLIVSFLALAIVATSATFALVGWQAQKITEEITKKAQEQNSQQETKTPTIAQNAFAEDLPANSGTNLLPAGSYPIGDNIPPKIEDTDTLTQRFIKQASYQTLKNNPDGPQSGEDGVSIIAPDINNILAASASEKDLVDAAQNWQPSESDLVTKTVPATKENIANYFKNLKDISDNYFVGVGIPRLSEQTVSGDTFKKTAINLNTFSQKLKELEVPVTFQEFHKNLLTVGIYQKNAFTFYGQNINDPVKIILTLQTRETEYINQLNKFNEEAKKIAFLAPQSEKQTTIAKIWKNTFGIKKAHAFLGLGDVVFDPSVLAQMIVDAIKDAWKWIYTTLIRILVNKIINQIQMDLFNWVGGGGKPKFVTNWKEELSKIGNDAASSIISKAAPKLCQSFGPLVEVALTPITDPTDQESLEITCTLDQVIDNAKNFYNSFSNGGWVAYATALRPENQIWGSMFMLNDKLIRQSEKSVSGARSEKESASGFSSGNTTCTKPQNRQTTNGEYASGLGELAGSVDIITTTCDASGKPDAICAVRVCEKGDYRINTPGGAVAHSLFGSLNWKPNQIVTAQRIEELVTALIDAAINRLTNLALGWVSGSGGGSEGGGNITCSGPGSNATPGCGGNISLPGDTSGGSNSNGQTQSDLINLAQSKITVVNQAITDYQSLQGLIQTPGKGPVCAAQNSADIAKVQDAFAALNLAQAKQKLQALITELQTLTTSNPNYNQRLLEILNEIQNTPSATSGNITLQSFQGMLAQVLGSMQQCITNTQQPSGSSTP